jgi:hypothetical protein
MTGPSNEATETIVPIIAVCVAILSSYREASTLAYADAPSSRPLRSAHCYAKSYRRRGLRNHRAKAGALFGPTAHGLAATRP